MAQANSHSTETSSDAKSDRTCFYLIDNDQLQGLEELQLAMGALAQIASNGMLDQEAVEIDRLKLGALFSRLEASVTTTVNPMGQQEAVWLTAEDRQAHRSARA